MGGLSDYLRVEFPPCPGYADCVMDTDLAEAAQLRCEFPRWVIYRDSYGITGRRRVSGVTESYTGRSRPVLRCQLMNAEFEEVIARVLAKSA